jgi:O-acetyl-ADP-ribose deacetylase (regulator of RNase III)
VHSKSGLITGSVLLIYTQKAQCRSIAFPVFGTGNLEYPWDEVAQTMIDTINKYGRRF